ncbi:MAG: hypothetical protein A3F90_06190 [Deltaproteobacteria bacterium RIFCSPLOWO2_12_FULL_60_19]|nr:MAG: hypothetical protein A3F90_06190 [Deltaproteobacteria bacterium RIFCSPLOWO2_12_FULL_60_19]
MKKLLYIGGALLVVIAIGLYFFLSSLNSIVKAAVEKVGSDATQAQVRLANVDIQITSGKGAMRGLTVGNPSGFKTDRAFSLGEISLQVDVGSVTKDTVVIKEIVIAAPEVTYELATGGSNIDALQRNLNAYAGGGGGKTEKSKGSSEGGRKLVIENLYVRNGKVNVSATALGGKTMTTPLPDIHLTNIGKQSGGATAGQVTQQVLSAIGQAAAKAATSLPEVGKLVGSMKERAAGVAGSAKEGAAKEAGEGLKKLFGK